MKRFVIILLTIFVASTASAQNYGGWLTDVSGIGMNDMLSLSQWNWSLGSARSSAMGGAVSALGADLSAVGINPAGIAAYRRGAFGISGSYGSTYLTHNQLSTDGYGHPKGRLALNNIGFVGIIDQRSSGVVSSNVAFTYNKLADFNYRMQAEFDGNENSIFDLFTLQLNGLLPYLNGSGWSGLQQNAIRTNANPFYNENIDSREWGAILAYQTWGINPASAAGSNSLYRIESLMSGTVIRPRFNYTGSGYVGQYDISWGGNINNTLYIGFSMGFQDIWQEQQFSYSEHYENNTPIPPYTSGDCLKSMTYNQTSRTSGIGFNAKFGIIYRPVPALRLALSYHTPTATALRREYEADMSIYFLDNSSEYASSDTYANSNQEYSSPSRLVGGIAYTLGNRVALSADWERVWYNGITVYGKDRYYRQEMNQSIRNDLRATDNIRVGIEVKSSPKLAVRLGYGYYGSPLKDNGLVFNAPVTTFTTNFTTGFGYSFNRNSRLDLAYILSQSSQTETDLYYYSGETLFSDGTATGSVSGEYTSASPLSPDAPINQINTIKHVFIATYTYSF